MIFILSAVRGPDKVIVSVFSSMDKLQDFKLTHPVTDFGNYAEYEIECVEIDAGQTQAQIK